MRVFVAGSRGQLGTELMRASWPAGTTVLGEDLPLLDITQPEVVEARVRAAAPDVLINAAAYTAVDKAESDRATAHAVNAEGPATLGRLARSLGIPLVHVSTDYVFGGDKNGAYLETDPIAPLGVYGETKAAGERAVREALDQHLILRTSWVFASHGANFVKTMLRLAADRDVLRVVADQRGRPTGARDLAQAIIARAPALVSQPDFPWGTYHFACTGETTWHQLAQHTVERAAARTGKRPDVQPITTADYPTPARRPANSVLDTTKFERTFGATIRSWQDSLAEVVDELVPDGKAHA